MALRAVILAILLVGLLASSLAQIGALGQNGPYPGGHSTWNSPTRNFNSISGSVLSADNRPVGNVRVELRDGNTATPLNSAHTGAAAPFEFPHLTQRASQIYPFSSLQQ